MSVFRALFWVLLSLKIVLGYFFVTMYRISQFILRISSGVHHIRKDTRLFLLKKNLKDAKTKKNVFANEREEDRRMDWLLQQN